MKEGHKLWTREELILALNLYLKLPFGKLHSRTPEIIHLAKTIQRSSNSVAMRLNNFASVDPFHRKRGIKGLEGGIKQVQPIWNEFMNDKEALLFESESILAKKENLPLERKYSEELKDLSHLKGEDKLREVKTRVNQSAFRKIVLANYNYRCAISSIDINEFLVASHIIPWSRDSKERLNPENGICLSPLYDRALDKGLISIGEDFTIKLSSKIKTKEHEAYYQRYFANLDQTKLTLPQKYLPKKEFLQFHLDTIFQK